MDLRRMRYLIDEDLPSVLFAIEKAESKAERSTANLTGMPRGSSGENQIESGLDVRLMLEAEKKQLLDELAQMREWLQPGVDSLENGMERRVMRVRYMCGNGHSLDDTAAMFGYCKRHTQRILERAEANALKNVTQCP